MNADDVPAGQAAPVLLPCPHCGGPAHAGGYEDSDNCFVECSGTCDGYFNSPAKAIAAWNRRARPPEPAAGEAAELAKLIRNELPYWIESYGPSLAYAPMAVSCMRAALLYVEAAARQPAPPDPPPRYDEVFAEGQRMLYEENDGTQPAPDPTVVAHVCHEDDFVPQSDDVCPACEATRVPVADPVAVRARELLVGWEREIHFEDDGTPTALGQVFHDVRDFLRSLAGEPRP